MEKIALINPNANVDTTKMMVTIASQVDQQVTIIGYTAENGPSLIANGHLLDASVDEVIEIARSLHGFDSIIVAAFGDPGAHELQIELALPVVGIGTASARKAGRDGLPFAVATTTLELKVRIDDLMQREGRGADYVGTFCSTEEASLLMTRPAKLDQALLCQIDRAARAGARQVIIGGGPLGQAAERLRKKTDVSLIYPLKEAVRECVALMKKKNSSGQN